jgi:hypothetical protein
MDLSQPTASRGRTPAIIAAAGLACLAIAVPVSGAFGAGNGNNGTPSASQQGGQGYGHQGMPNGKCPKHRGSSGQSQG